MASKCTETRYVSGSWRPEACGRDATGDDGLCNQHRAGKKRRDARNTRIDEEIAARNVQWRIERAQAAVVRSWREQHPEQVWGDTHQCPLCGYVMQASSTFKPDYLAERIADHQRLHGDDWQQYEAAGTDAAGADQRGGV